MSTPIEIKVRGYHLDVFGHVNNARYLEFLEEARWALLENHLATLASKGLAFVVVNININYRSSATLGDLVEIHSVISRFGGKSCTLTQKMIKKGSQTTVVEAEVTFVILGTDGRPLAMEGELHKMLTPFADKSL
ncbi:MAG: acyl-CoA thioesterase [Desulfobacterales bacterium]|nr:acyl-CoA thioesterase [Desulfobacterales bacterium]